ncbi:hypothetical protein DsansV1_C25g0186041 [Dioscorea sansibarensis]
MSFLGRTGWNFKFRAFNIVPKVSYSSPFSYFFLCFRILVVLCL